MERKNLLVVWFMVLILAVPSIAYGAAGETPTIEEEKYEGATSISSDTAEIITEEEEEEHAKNAEKVYSSDITSNKAPTEPSLDPAYEDGTTKIVHYAYGAGGLIEEQSESGYYNGIYDLAMYVAGLYVDTFGALILFIADQVGKGLDESQWTVGKTYKSYRYIGKEAQVYDSGVWSMKYDSRSREIFKHYFSTFVADTGYTYSDTKDFTRPNGYSPITTNYAPNYTNDTELKKRGYENWVLGYEYWNSPEYGY